MRVQRFAIDVRIDGIVDDDLHLGRSGRDRLQHFSVGTGVAAESVGKYGGPSDRGGVGPILRLAFLCPDIAAIHHHRDHADDYEERERKESEYLSPLAATCSCLVHWHRMLPS